ncbi:dehydrogenase [Cenarchaeum symbiosum A]|uniref:Dehydrogenase n=1 Tax=Cenarchaeum symbiosum (strain A) TaxID=414004 RepID=A0RX73_CENSY|nr:dehydrogenase [Cenarchaeum symbiosum A]
MTVQDGAARAAVLDVRGTYRWLAARAEGAGARIFTGTPATGVIMDKGRVAGVTAGGARLRAGVVIDASGFQSAVSKHAGLPHSWSRFGAGAEYEIRAENADPDTWWLMVGSKYSPAGYAWIFPVGGDIVRVGVGVGKPESGADPRVLLDRIMKEDAGPVAALGRTEMIESHYGLIPNDGPSRKTAYDGLLLVGDSAGQANPLVLEGIRYAIRFGGLAGETAASAAAAGDTSFGALKAYEDGGLLQYGRGCARQAGCKKDGSG